MIRRRPLMRAAVVGGGAYMVGKNAARRQAGQSQAEAEQQTANPPQSAPAQPPAQAGSSSMVDQLNQLAQLHQQGSLTDDEFAAAKAKLF
jgi:Short C-terminal domain